MNKPYKQKVSVSLDEDVIAEIKELAENDDRSFSQYINLVLKEHIAKIKGKEEQGGLRVSQLWRTLIFLLWGFFESRKKFLFVKG